MGRKRPERDLVERLLKTNRRRRAHDIAEETGLIDTMGYEKAVDYVRRVRKEMRRKGELPRKEYIRASDEDRVADIDKLFELRQGKMSKKVAKSMLRLNCYYRLRSEDYDTHMRAIDNTYAKCGELRNVDMATAMEICEEALERYAESRDDEMNQTAISLGFPGAGINYSSQSLIEILEITDEELHHMISIKRED